MTTSASESGARTLTFTGPLVVLAGICAVGAVLAASLHPLALIVPIGAAIAALLIWRDVDFATSLVLFVVYSNAAVVAVNYHGVPALAANAIVGLLLVPLLYHAIVRRRGFTVGASFPWIIAFAGVQLLGVLFSERPVVAWQEFQTFLLEGVLLYLLIVNTVRTENSLRGVTTALLLAGCLMGGVPILQQVTGTFDNEYGGLAQTGGEPGFRTGEVTAAGDVLQFRLAGPIGEKNRYAQIMLMLVPLALIVFRQERRGYLKWMAAIAMICAGAGSLLAFSRSTIIAAGLVVMLAAGMRFVSRTKVALVLVLGFAALLATPQYRTRMTSLLNLREMLVAGRHSSADGALKGRATEMGAAGLAFIDHPFVGVGPGMFKYYSREYGERIGLRDLDPERQAHCLLLDVAAENGGLGLLALLGVFAATGWGLYRASVITAEGSRLQGLAIAYLLMVAAYFATGLFLHFAFIRYFWLMIALADCTVCIVRNSCGEPSHVHSPRGRQRLPL